MFVENDQVKLKVSSRIEDEAVLEIDFKKDLDVDQITEARNFKLFADYTDDQTNKTFSASTTFVVDLNDFIIDIVHSPQFFKPGIPYSFTVLVTKVNGYPVLDSQKQVQVQVRDNLDTELLNGRYSLNPQTGSVEVATANGISYDAEHLEISVNYEGVNYSRIVYKILSSQKQFVSLNVLTPR